MPHARSDRQRRSPTRAIEGAASGALESLIDDVDADELTPRLQQPPNDRPWLAVTERQPVDLDDGEQAVGRRGEHRLLGLVEVELREGALVRLQTELLGELHGGKQADAGEVRPALRDPEHAVGDEQE